MIRRLILLAAIAAVLALAAFWYLTAPASVPASALAAHTPDLANGKEMFYAAACASCHGVPKQPDKTRLGGGLALNSPFGTFYVPNISSDRKDGIGAWTDAQFVTAMTKGTSPSGEHLYPAFPYTSYQHMRLRGSSSIPNSPDSSSSVTKWWPTARSTGRWARPWPSA